MSSSATAGKAKMAKMINKLITSSDFRILDLGCGRGTYARLINKPCYKIAIDAVDYTEKFELLKWYDKFYQHDIRDIEFLKKFYPIDLSIAGDVLEHMTVKDAQKVLATMQEISETVIVALPYTYEQKGRGGNHWEDHIQSDLTPELVRKRYPSLFPVSIHNRKASPWNGGPFYGYYVWRKDM